MAIIKWIKKYERRVQVVPMPPKRTNADRIRAMTDEELAEWLKTIVQSMSLPIAFVGFDEKEMVEDWLAWLKKEVNDG